MSDLQILIMDVIEQIKRDIAKGDVTAVEKLLMCVSSTRLEAYLPADEPFDFTWGYRIVNTKSANGGDDWYCLKEVAYNAAGQPTGYGDPCTGSETVESMREVWDMMSQAMDRPVLQEEDFVQTTGEEE